MEIDLNGEATALCRACPQCGRCPGLGNCRARLVLADKGNNAAARLPPTGGSSVRHRSLTILSPVSRSKAAASTRQDSTPLLSNPALPSAGETEGRVLCSWRLDEIEARFWRAPPGAASLPPGPNQSEPYGLV
jgi:hypothetical protein